MSALVRFQEQREGAYTLNVPKGWKASAVIQQGKTYRQRTYVSVIGVPSIHCWWADVIGLICVPIEQFEQYEPVLNTVVFSLQWNAQWLQSRNARLQMLASQFMQQGLMSQQMAQAQMLQGQRMVMETGNTIYSENGKHERMFLLLFA